jgi:hypothetical protein
MRLHLSVSCAFVSRAPVCLSINGDYDKQLADCYSLLRILHGSRNGWSQNGKHHFEPVSVYIMAKSHLYLIAIEILS